VFDNLKAKIISQSSQNYSFEYDQIVSLGEVLSSSILSAYLSEKDFPATWIDARELVQTDNNYQQANVDWGKTEIAISRTILPKFKEKKVLITQGFIGGTAEEKPLHLEERVPIILLQSLPIAVMSKVLLFGKMCQEC